MPDTEATVESTKQRVSPRRPWLMGLGLLLIILLLGGIAAWWRARPSAQVEFIQVEEVFEQPNFLARLVADARAHLNPPSVYIQSEMFSSDRLESGEKAAALMGRKALAEQDATMVWILEQADLGRFVAPPLAIRRNELIAAPKLFMGEGQRGWMFTGSTLVNKGGVNLKVGTEMVATARRSGKVTDLIFGFVSTHLEKDKRGSDVLKTNGVSAARIQLMDSQSVLLVCERNDGEPPLCIRVAFHWN